jgi:hypothetical protein
MAAAITGRCAMELPYLSALGKKRGSRSLTGTQRLYSGFSLSRSLLLFTHDFRGIMQRGAGFG